MIAIIECTVIGLKFPCIWKHILTSASVSLTRYIELSFKFPMFQSEQYSKHHNIKDIVHTVCLKYNIKPFKQPQNELYWPWYSISLSTWASVGLRPGCLRASRIEPLVPDIKPVSRSATLSNARVASKT